MRSVDDIREQCACKNPLEMVEIMEIVNVVREMWEEGSWAEEVRW
jgi:hypothetical protein